MDEIKFEMGDKVTALQDIGLGAIIAGETFRVQRMNEAGNLVLWGEEGSWSPEYFSITKSAKAMPQGPAFPSPSEQPEALSVCISIDHVMRSAASRGEAFANLQFSGLDEHDVLCRQAAYFISKGEGPNLLSERHHRATMVEAAGHNAFFVYTPSPRLTNLIMSAGIFGAYCDDNGGVMPGVAAAVQEADIMHENFSRAGRDTSLMAYIPDAVQFPPEKVVARSKARYASEEDGKITPSSVGNYASQER